MLIFGRENTELNMHASANNCYDLKSLSYSMHSLFSCITLLKMVHSIKKLLIISSQLAIDENLTINGQLLCCLVGILISYVRSCFTYTKSYKLISQSQLARMVQGLRSQFELVAVLLKKHRSPCDVRVTWGLPCSE